MSDGMVAQVAAAWLEPNRQLAPQLHPTVKAVFARYLEHLDG